MAINELKILIGLHRTTNTIDRKTAHFLQKYNLSLSQFAVLEVLYHKGDLSIGEIQDKILSSTGTITLIINNLIKYGYIQKIQCATDKRKFFISLTSEGKSLIKEIFPINVEMIKEHLSVLSSDEKKQLVDLLSKISR